MSGLFILFQPEMVFGKINGAGPTGGRTVLGDGLEQFIFHQSDTDFSTGAVEFATDAI